MTHTRLNRRWQQATLLIAALMITSGCSVKTYAINMVGDALASGNSVYETDDDLTLVGDALPFGLKLTESLGGRRRRSSRRSCFCWPSTRS